ncbi:MAG: DNA polymerase III subunit beta [Clostridia bacterium]|nr:DNA polymerase III subunit beta [Clostridia bacterium]
MFIRVDKKAFLETISPCLCAVSSRSANAALACLHFKTAKEEGKLVITTFDTTKGVKTQMEAEVLEEGSILLDAIKMNSMVRSLPDGVVNIASDANFVTTISSGNVKFEILGMTGDAFPSMPMLAGDKKFVIPQGTLKKMLQQVIFACAVIDQRPILTGVLFETHGEKLRLCSCDGYRIAIRDEECIKGLTVDSDFVVPAKTLQELIRLLSDGEEEIRIELARRHIIFAFEDFFFFSRYVDGQYIDYKKSLPKEFKTEVTISLHDTISCFERCALLIDERAKSPIRLQVIDGAIQVKCTTSNGKIDEEILCKVEGGEILMGFNNKFLLDALRGAAGSDCDEVVMKMTSPFSGMVITGVGTDAFYYMVVPINPQKING